MKLAPVERLDVVCRPRADRPITVGRLARTGRSILFEYDADFVARGLSLSPFKLPLAPGVVVGDPAVFDGLPGLFDDSLPDGCSRPMGARRSRARPRRPRATRRTW